MLDKNPLLRININDILLHPWLSDYRQIFSRRSLSGDLQLERFDEGVLQKVVEFGFNRNYVIKSILQEELNHATATYYLIENSV